MKKAFFTLSSCILISVILIGSCNSGNKSKNDISTDTAAIANGKALFITKCGSCHNFRNDGIGPKLNGITSTASVSWIKQFIHDPNAVIQSGDTLAKKLYEKFHLIMPSFASLPDGQVNNIIAYLNTHNKVDSGTAKSDSNSLKDPIPEHIAMSDLVLSLEDVTQIPASSTDSILHTRIAKLDVQPKTSNIFISDLRGKLYRIVNGRPVVYFDMAKAEPKFIHEPGMATGFGSFAFHPDFAKNGLLYMTHTEPAKSKKADFDYGDSIKTTLQWVLSEFKTDHPDEAIFSGRERELLRVNMVTQIHGVQEVTFNPLAKAGDKDYGMLYIGVGDGGSVEEGYFAVPHGKDKIWGSIIRIDPSGKDSRNGQYGIPKDNPFYSDTDPKTVKEIYAFGFRNPHRITWSKSGQMLASNIGQGNIESLYIILPGHDYGWPVREGNFLLEPLSSMISVYPLPPNDSVNHFTYPVAEYDHGEGNAISGGFEYTGTKVPQLNGKYVFGDVANGRLFYVQMADLKIGSLAPIKEWTIEYKGQRKTLKELCGSNHVDLRFGKDDKGELYVFTKPDGKVYRIVSNKKA